MTAFNELVVLLVVAISIAIISYKLRFPYTIGLVVFGVVLGLVAPRVPFVGQLSGQTSLFSEDVFFGILLPPLIFEAALHIDFHSLRSNARLILFFTFIGVILSTLLTGFLVSSFAAIPLVFALLLGAILSPTDPVAVVDLFKRLDVPRELSTIVESESLLNDAMGIVAFVAISQITIHGEFEVLASLREFVVLVFGGFSLGLAFAGIAYLLHRRIEDPNIETALSVITAYGSFSLARALGVSAIICTAVAGIAFGTWVVPRALSDEVLHILFSFWSVIVYIVNSLVFLAMGLLINFSEIFQNLPMILGVLGFVTMARALFVHAPYPLSRILGRNRIPLSWYTVITLAGVRGAIPIVLALSLLNASLPIPPYVKDLIISTVTGVALLSITLQNLTAAWYTKRQFRGRIADSQNDKR